MVLIHAQRTNANALVGALCNYETRALLCSTLPTANSLKKANAVTTSIRCSFYFDKVKRNWQNTAVRVPNAL